MYPPPKGASNIPGLECSGTVVAVTEDCLDFKWAIRCAVF